MSEIDEIRARHEAGERASADADRAWLLGEVERLTREIEKLRRFAEAVSVHGPDDDSIVWLRIDLSATGGHARWP